MDIKDILAKCDYTLLDRSATWADVKAVIDDGIKYRTASICIPPCFVKAAKQQIGDKIAICTVIGFPNGYNTTETKLFETIEAINNGADEIDVVINVGELKAKNYDFILSEIKALKKACGDKILKVIIETCLLSDEEKIVMCDLVSRGGADYIKTSTGFAAFGARLEDVALMRKHLSPDVKIKAAGGIRTIKDAEDFINLGADRIGTSGIIKAVKALIKEE